MSTSTPPEKKQSLRPGILTLGSMGGEGALQADPNPPAVRGLIKPLEAYAAESQQMALSEMLIKEGMASHHLMAQSFLTYLLLDVRDYRAGLVPDQPLAARVQPKARQHDN
ncbi:MAG: hypothetical protein V4675_00005 [Verrucomicrobiota bacterium]